MRQLKLLMVLAVVLCGLGGSALAAAPVESDSTQRNRAVTAFNENNFEMAAHIFADLADNAASEEIKYSSEYYLAQAWFKLGLYNAALRQYNYIIKAGNNHPFYLRAVEGVVNVGEVLHEDYITGTLIDREYNDEFAKLPIEVLNKINYTVGAVLYRGNKFPDALNFLQAVPIDAVDYARAKYLTAIIGVFPKKDTTAEEMANSEDEAKRIFEEILKLKNTPNLTYVDLERIQQLSTLGLARLAYGKGEYAEAVKQYERIPRFSAFWDAALFENGWARFQNNDYGGALGSLQALHAPQFAGSFQPESWILKATVFFRSCLYADAKAALDGFAKIYLPIQQQVDELLTGEKTDDYYYELLSSSSKTLPRSVKNYLLGNSRMVQFKSYIDQLERERRIINGLQRFKDSKLQAELLSSIDQAKILQIRITGSFAKRRLADVSAMIRGFDVEKELINFELTSAETNMLSSKFDQAAHLDGLPIYRPAMPGTAWQYWQFEGEFWLDEIGYYQYTLKTGCMNSGAEQSALEPQENTEP